MEDKDREKGSNRWRIARCNEMIAELIKEGGERLPKTIEGNIEYKKECLRAVETKKCSEKYRMK